MNIKKIQKIIALCCFSFLFAFFTAKIASAQTDSTPKIKLNSPAIVKGFIGGEAHNSYMIRVRKGQTLIVQISWRKEENNRADFTISRSANFFNANPIKFGKESNKGKQWIGKIPSNGTYYIYVVAHPTANYTLKVTLKD